MTDASEFEDFNDLDDGELETVEVATAFPTIADIFGAPKNKNRKSPDFLIGRLVIVWPQSIEQMSGDNGTYDAVKCRIALLDGPPIEGFEDVVPETIPAVMDDALLTAGKIVSTLSRRINAGKMGPVVQRLNRRQGKMNNWAYSFTPATVEEVETARAFLRSRSGR